MGSISERCPFNYWKALPRERQLNVYKAIRRAYAYTSSQIDIAADCTQVACEIVFSYPKELRSAPLMQAPRDEKWYRDAEAAIVGFVTSDQVRVRLIKKVRKQNFSRPLRADMLPEVADSSADIQEQAEARAAHQRQCTYVKALKALVPDKKNEHAVLVLNLLSRFAEGMDLETPSNRAFRGAQISNVVLLAALYRNYPEIPWDMEMVQKAIADLRRYASKLEERFAKDNVYIFGNNRPGKAEARSERKVESERRPEQRNVAPRTKAGEA
jgi:hypothetical protein